MDETQSFLRLCQYLAIGMKHGTLDEIDFLLKFATPWCIRCRAVVIPSRKNKPYDLRLTGEANLHQHSPMHFVCEEQVRIHPGSLTNSIWENQPLPSLAHTTPFTGAPLLFSSDWSSLWHIIKGFGRRHLQVSKQAFVPATCFPFCKTFFG